MENFLEKNNRFDKLTARIFLAIVIFAVIIGGFIYFGLKNNTQNPKQSQSIGGSDPPITPKVATDVRGLQNTSSAASSAKCAAADQTIVTKVIDGDTVVVEGGEHVRLLGMDADENGYPCYLPAKTRLEELILSKQVKLEKDKTDVDQYGRCLRYIFLGGTNIDVQLVEEGLAIARFYEPDVKYKTEITSAEKQAETSKTGCKWSGSSQTSN